MRCLDGQVWWHGRYHRDGSPIFRSFRCGANDEEPVWVCARRDWVQDLVRQIHESLYQRKLKRLCSGNPLGTRYRPCKAAAEGLFSTAITPSHPNHPSGSAYWRNPPSPLLTSTCYIYTLFPDHVSSFPPLHLTSTSSSTNARSITRPTAEQPSGAQPPTSDTTTSQSRLRSEFDADGNPIGESANSPDKVVEAWSGR